MEEILLKITAGCLLFIGAMTAIRGLGASGIGLLERAGNVGFFFAVTAVCGRVFGWW